MSYAINLKVEYTNKLAQENEALRLQVNMLENAITTALQGTAFDDFGNRDADGLIPFGETKTAISVLTDALCELSKSKKSSEASK